MRRSVRSTVVLERGVGRGETNAFDHGLEFIRSAMFLAVLLAFRDLSLAFGDSKVGIEGGDGNETEI